MRNPTMRRLAVAAVLGLVPLAACGDGDGSDNHADDPGAAAEAVGAADGDGAGDVGDADESDASDGETGTARGSDDGGYVVSDDTRLSAAVFAFETTYKTERIEVDGHTVQIYLGDESRLFAGTECASARMIFPDGVTFVFHRDGEAIPCE